MGSAFFSHVNISYTILTFYLIILAEGISGLLFEIKFRLTLVEGIKDKLFSYKIKYFIVNFLNSIQSVILQRIVMVHFYILFHNDHDTNQSIKYKQDVLLV